METKNTDQITVGFPYKKDVFGIRSLISIHVTTGELLPRSIKSIAQDLSSWVVAKNANGKVVGCASLLTISEPMAEVRSVAVCPSMRGKGVGAAMMKVVCALAKTRKITILYAFTRAKGFFKRFGFAPVQGHEKKRKEPLELEEETLWTPGNRCPRKGQTVMVADTRSLDPKVGVPETWPQSAANRSAPEPISEMARHYNGMHLPTRRQYERIHSR